MNEELEVEFGKQITREFESAMLYRQLAVELELRDLPGMASWMRNHSSEELGHADRLVQHMTNRENRPVIGDIAIPSIKADTVTEIFEIALDAEKDISEAIRALYRLAQEQGDIDSRPTIDWFVSEQIEEEATVSEIVGRLHLVNEDGSGLLRMDAELASAGA
ncbi:ferritin [Gordonia neofelifaecis]|uniref:Ferritin n=1 Tax=Gordonia neofelifaecis NRRL B-59395 TaxID=644548 RepID=F1YK41_9ACTN|nr:Ferritin Dps family protein [Gordonia neofelifaecis NRRL B-59395]